MPLSAPMKALVVSVMTWTLASAVAPTELAAAMPAATEVMSCFTFAFTSMSPSTLALTPESI